MRMMMLLIALAIAMPTTQARAGGSADEIRKTITGRTCSAPGVTYHFGRDGTFRRQESAWRGGMRASWQGTYTVSEGAVSLNIQQGSPVKGVSVASAWITGNTLQITSFFANANGGTVAFACR
jgi:hypothetical protein